MDRPLAALTGATGFLGRHVAQALHEAGWRLRVLARGDAAPEGLEPFEPQVVAGRLGDPPALERLVEGAQAVVHAAGLIKAAKLSDFLKINAEGAATVARAAARRAPDARFILVSSLSAREPSLSAYAASKAAGEAAVRAVLAPERLTPARLTIVRPPAIYGPGDRETLALFQAAASLPMLPLLGGARARIAVIHVADAAAQIAALASQPCEGQTWALADGRPEGYGWRELLETATRTLGRHPPLVRLPPAVILGLGATNSLIARLGGPAQILSLGKAREMLHTDWSVGPAELAPNIPPARFGLAEGFADVVVWYRAQGWLKGQAVLSTSPEG